jgi:uncharacterized protein (TIGR02300 family)
MPAKDLGTKHLCFKCGTRFYDLKKPEPLCPKCGANQRDSPARSSRPPSEKRTRSRAPVEQEAVPEESLVEEADLEEEPGGIVADDPEDLADEEI